MNADMLLFVITIDAGLLFSLYIISWNLASKFDKMERELKEFREKVGV